MEQDLHVRDRVGVQDFVLLENHTSETEFIENLQKRSKEELIYVRFHILNLALFFFLSHYQQSSPICRRTLDQFWFLLIPTRTSPSTGQTTLKSIVMLTFTNCHLTCKKKFFQ
jgi:hypothetical protein